MKPSSMIRLEPWDIWNDINKMINASVSSKGRNGDLAAAQESIWAPAVDIDEDEQQFRVHADLPGVKDEDIHISVDENNIFTLRGQRQAEKKEAGKESLRWERSFGSFSRSFSLPNVIDADAITATFKDGVLQVVIPKRQAKTDKRIKIQRG